MSHHNSSLYNMKKFFVSLNTYQLQAYMGMDTLAGQHHRHGVVWVIKVFGCDGSGIHIPGKPSFLKVSASNEID